MKPILLFAIGNESRGDDALGPRLAREIETWLEKSQGDAPVEVIEEFQLQIENTLDMLGRDLVLFVDAGQGRAAPFSFYEARPAPCDAHTSHALTPEALLGVFDKVHAIAPPAAFVLCVAGVGFGLGEPLSGAAASNLERATGFCRQLFEQPTPGEWRRYTEIDHA
ncbi:hydrogenase maturation protease [Propionivibrio limicola]|uniref:hydrogenase maturation protease n=1 Tax=Propionivibrio limicola TaxID=167645 RepID=UPI0012925965|nr:hydrogenase maturation protease [Propionivibrio limicola]